ncbi:MAG: acylneuraminate cytidylyltransferase family protein [Candidatus Omnitrophica bacterium]|nr:acylneuraminate cytidylyltransferase family protein [Candidatus Omnitrophota bacterium]
MGKIIAIIPARSGSKGVIDKNIKPLGGFPLLAYSIAAARLVKGIDRVIVSTDSQQYADIARKYKGEVPFLRPKEISQDSSGDYGFIKHALDWLQKTEDYQPEYLIHLRPTTPLREPSIIQAAIKCIKAAKEATSLRSVHQMSETAYKSFEVEGGYLKCIITGSKDTEAVNRPRQEFKDTYQANGHVDIIKSSYVLENRKIYGDKVIGYITPRAAEVDIAEDFDYLEYQIARQDNPIYKYLRENFPGEK